MERTLVLVKPDGVQRKLVGEVIRRFEMSGLKIVGLKMVRPSKTLASQNYPDTKEWYEKVGTRSISTFKEMGVDIKSKFGTDNAEEIGKQIKGWLVRFLASDRVIAMVLEGNRAVDHVRRIVGETDPLKAAAGTIRGDLSIDNVIHGNSVNRPMVNVVHASGNLAEAATEINVWFKQSEIFEYRRDSDDVFYRVW